MGKTAKKRMKTKTKIPMRQCTGCREMLVLRTPENQILLDTTGRKNGRGAYLCRSMECFEKAVKNHGLQRSLKTEIPAEVYESLQKEFEELDNKKQ